MIALLCPSKGRPEKLQRMIQSAYDTTSTKVQIYVTVSFEEFEIYKATLSLPESNRVGLVIITLPELMPTAHKWNKLAELAMTQDNKLFMVAGDDMVFDTQGWDKALVSDHIHVYHLQDSRDQDGTPHPIVTREWIDAMGYFVPPLFLHWYIDTWTIEIAKYNNCFTHLKDFSLLHQKNNDHTHTGIRSYGWHDRDKYVHETCENTLLVNECQRLRSLMRK